MTARALAAIARASGKNSTYSEEAKRYIARGGYATYVLRPIIGVVEALVYDLKAGYLQRFRILLPDF